MDKGKNGKMYPSELKERAVRMVRELQQADQPD
jgi:hypothetical protein